MWSAKNGQMDSRQEQEVRTYRKRDAIIPICIVVFASFARLPLRPLLDALSIDFGAWPRTIEPVVFLMLPTIILLLLTKQNFASIGIHKKNLLPAMRLGLMFSLIPILGGLLPRILYGGDFVGFDLLAVLLVQVFIRAAAEDMLYTGYIQTRLYGLFKSDAAAIAVGAAVFSFTHLPGWLAGGRFDGVAHMIVMIVIWFIMHVVFAIIYRRYNSLIPVMILHTAINFMNHQHDIWTFAENHRASISGLVSLVTLITPLAIGVWAFIRYRKAKKATKANDSPTSQE